MTDAVKTIVARIAIGLLLTGSAAASNVTHASASDHQPKSVVTSLEGFFADFRSRANLSKEKLDGLHDTVLRVVHLTNAQLIKVVDSTHPQLAPRATAAGAMIEQTARDSLAQLRAILESGGDSKKAFEALCASSANASGTADTAQIHRLLYGVEKISP